MASLASSVESSAKIIPLFTKSLQGEHVQLCNARDLHASLQIGKAFSTWIADRIEKYGFIEGEDYYLDFPNRENQKTHGGDRRTKNYHITLDMAKELAMIENNAQGRAIRKYFIAVEKEARKAGLIQETINPAQQLQLRRAVAKIASKPEHFKAAYHQLHDQFQISEYKQLPASQIDAALEFIASLEGEFIPKQELPNALHELPKPTQTPIEYLFSNEVAEARKRTYDWYFKAKSKMEAAGLGDPGFPELNIEDMINTILLEQLGAVRVLVSIGVDKEMRMQPVPQRAVVIVPEDMPTFIKSSPGLSPSIMPEIIKAAAGKL